MKCDVTGSERHYSVQQQCASVSIVFNSDSPNLYIAHHTHTTHTQPEGITIPEGDVAHQGDGVPNGNPEDVEEQVGQPEAPLAAGLEVTTFAARMLVMVVPMLAPRSESHHLEGDEAAGDERGKHGGGEERRLHHDGHEDAHEHGE
eukprot:8149162-Pyramimonas_sp.AAC.1